MKKKLFSLIIFFIITLISYSKADSHDVDYTQFYLSEKNNGKSTLYNIYVRDWNDHVKDLYEDSSCQDIPFTKNYLTDYTNCSYRNTKMITKRNKMNFKEFVEAEHDVYLDLINRAEIIERKWTYDTSNNIEEQTVFWKHWGQVYKDKNYYLREVIKNKAIEAQKDWSLNNSSEIKEKKNNIENKNKRNNEIDFKNYWWVVIILALGAFFLYTKTVPKPKKTRKVIKNKPTGFKKDLINYWHGKVSYAYSYWACLTIIGTIISLPALYFFTDQFIDNASELVLLALILYALFVIVSQIYLIVGTWRSAEFYKAQKRKLKQSLIWGYLGQISIVLSVIRKFAEFF